MCGLQAAAGATGSSTGGGGRVVTGAVASMEACGSGFSLVKRKRTEACSILRSLPTASRSRAVIQDTGKSPSSSGLGRTARGIGAAGWLCPLGLFRVEMLCPLLKAVFDALMHRR